jgi:hypothetical protein
MVIDIYTTPDPCDVRAYAWSSFQCASFALCFHPAWIAGSAIGPAKMRCSPGAFETALEWVQVTQSIPPMQCAISQVHHKLPFPALPG